MPEAREETPAGVTSRANAEHYAWGEHCQGWHLVRGSGLSVIEEVMPPGTAEQVHRHLVAQQFFYMLSGEVMMEFENTKVTVRQGEGLHVEPGVAHRIRNASHSDARFLVISQPSTKNGDRENLGEWAGR